MLVCSACKLNGSLKSIASEVQSIALSSRTMTCPDHRDGIMGSGRTFRPFFIFGFSMASYQFQCEYMVNIWLIYCYS
jgi:hypothetical protein